MINGWRFFSVSNGEEDSPLLKGQWATWYKREFSAECWITGEAIHSHKWRDSAGEIDFTLIKEHLTVTKKRCVQHLLDPENLCACGVYISSFPGQFSPILEIVSGVYASVVGWGATRPYELGWRVENIRLEHLWVPSITCHPECAATTVETFYESQGLLASPYCPHRIPEILSGERRPIEWLVEGLQNRYEVGVTIGSPPETEEEKHAARKTHEEALQRIKTDSGPYISSTQNKTLRTHTLSWGGVTLKIHTATSPHQIFSGIDLVITR